MLGQWLHGVAELNYLLHIFFCAIIREQYFCPFLHRLFMYFPVVECIFLFFFATESSGTSPSASVKYSWSQRGDLVRYSRLSHCACIIFLSYLTPLYKQMPKHGNAKVANVREIISFLSRCVRSYYFFHSLVLHLCSSNNMYLTAFFLYSLMP